MRDRMTTPMKADLISRPQNGLLPTDIIIDSGEFEALYDTRDYINSGTYGQVYKCQRKASKGATEYAVKKQDVSATVNDEHSSYMKTLNEARIWKSVNHKNIAKLYQCFFQRNRFYFVMELVPGQNLFDEILKRMQYTEKDACFYIRQVLSALAYLHTNRIVHRDMKPDNVMVYKDTGRGSTTSVVKLIDFGLSRRLSNEEERMKCSYSGAPLYLAPETILGLPLGRPVDIWSCGVILYILLYGTPPFWSEDTDKLFVDIVGSSVDYSCNGKESVSFLAKDLIQEMLVKEQNVRITANEAIDHPWFVQAPKLPQQHRRSTIEQLTVFRKCSVALEARFKAKNSLNCDDPLSV